MGADAITERRLRRRLARLLGPTAIARLDALGPHEHRALRRGRELNDSPPLRPLPVSDEMRPVEDEIREQDVHWIEVALVDEEGQPYPNEPYVLELPDGSVKRGRLDAEGLARVERIGVPGSCKLTFPELDQDAWAPA